MRPSSLSIGALALALMLGAPACGTSSPPSGSTTSTSTADAPQGPPVETTLFAPQKPVLADLPVTKLLPKDTPFVLAVRDPATILAKLATTSTFAEAKDPLAKEIDDAAKELTKDLPDLAALAQNGVDLAKPVGVIWTSADLDTIAIFAAVNDEAAMKRWLEERAKQAKGREVLTVDDALVLRAKRNVTRAIVLRRGHVFWVRSKDGWRLDPERVTRAADALAKTAEADSLGADATFTSTLGSLAYGAQATLYANTARFGEALVAARAKRVEEAKKKLEDAEKTLAETEKKKRKSAIESAKYDRDQAEREVRSAENGAKQVQVLADLKDDVPAFAAGVDLGDREVRLKAFVAMPKPGAVKLFAPLAAPSPVLDASLGARSAAQISADPRLLAFVSDRFGLQVFSRSALPIDRAQSALSTLGVDAKSLEPLLDGEVSGATHRQKIEAPVPAPDPSASATASAPAAPATTDPSASAKPATTAAPALAEEADGYTVLWHLSDAAKAAALFDEKWKALETSTAVTEGKIKRTAPGAFELFFGGRTLTTYVRLAGSSLLVTTHPKLAEAAPSVPSGSWLASADHPVLRQLAGIDGACAVLAFDGDLYRRARNADPFGGGDLLRSMADIGVLGSLLGPESAKSKKLSDQRAKLREQRRDLERAHDAHEETTWKTFAARLGTTALFAKPVSGGVAVYGGLFPKEPSVIAVAEAALGAWLAAGPRWEKWGEMVELDKKIHALDEQIDAERQKAMDTLVGDVLMGLGTSEAGMGRPGRFGGFDDDVGSLLDGPGSGGLGSLGTRGGGSSGVGVGVGGLGGGTKGQAGTKP